MVANIKRLVYFQEFMDPIALRILAGRPDIEVVKLEYKRRRPRTGVK